MRYTPSRTEFSRLTRSGNLIPVYREILANQETPVSAFPKISDGRYAFLLESVEGGEKWARFSFLGSSPSVVLRCRDNGVEVIRGRRVERLEGFQNPLEAIRKFMAQYQPVTVPGLPRFFGGAVGFMSYDLVHDFEPVPERPKPGMGSPDFLLMITDTLLIFDSLSQKIKIVANAHIGAKGPQEAYRLATGKIERLIKKLNRRAAPRSRRTAAPRKSPLRWRSNITRRAFEQKVRKSKSYIRAGDIFQVVLSQRFSATVRADPVEIYRALRVINPSPYMYCLIMDDLKVVGSSPEVLVRCEEGQVEVRPIAGTRPRGSTPAEDQALADELRSDAKECAEHLMLVDLGRNDVGRVSEMGEVQVDEFMGIEQYSHVMHLVTNVQGRLDPTKDAYDAFRACFPAGTVTGAPKIRAMQIIDELETTQRGLYAGAVGYFSFSGNMDTCINIRTIVMQGQQAHIQAGAGIVADSKPAREYDETVSKAKGLVKAVEMAERGGP